MAKPETFVPQKLRPWVEARNQFRLTDAQVRMARELGMNPRKLGGLDKHRQEPWKVPLPEFIERCYEKQFGRKAPEDVRSIEDRLKDRKEPGSS